MYCNFLFLGEFRGGSKPDTNPRIASLAPDGTVPVAIFPGFEKQPLYPTECVIYSEVSDFEDRDIGNMQMDQVKTIKEGEHKKVKNLEYKVITNRLINS